jgi:hypothetical protein
MLPKKFISILCEKNEPIMIFDYSEEAIHFLEKIMDNRLEYILSLPHQPNIYNDSFENNWVLTLEMGPNGFITKKELITYNPINKQISKKETEIIINEKFLFPPISSLHQNTLNQNILHSHKSYNTTPPLNVAMHNTVMHDTAMHNTAMHNTAIQSAKINLKENKKLDQILNEVRARDNKDQIKELFPEAEQEKKITEELKNDEYYLDELILKKEELEEEIEDDEDLIDLANKNLNDELFEQRVHEQNEKKKKMHEEENFSVFCSNISTYMKMRLKIENGKKEENCVPILFRDKYSVYKFMDENNLINLRDEDPYNRKIEMILFDQLYKIIESYNWGCQGKNDENDPIHDIDDEYKEICLYFLAHLEENNTFPITADRIHEKLNEEMTGEDKNCFKTN